MAFEGFALLPFIEILAVQKCQQKLFVVKCFEIQFEISWVLPASSSIEVSMDYLLIDAERSFLKITDLFVRGVYSSDKNRSGKSDISLGVSR